MLGFSHSCHKGQINPEEGEGQVVRRGGGELERIIPSVGGSLGGGGGGEFYLWWRESCWSSLSTPSLLRNYVSTITVRSGELIQLTFVPFTSNFPCSPTGNIT